MDHFKVKLVFVTFDNSSPVYFLNYLHNIKQSWKPDSVKINIVRPIYSLCLQMKIKRIRVEQKDKMRQITQEIKWCSFNGNLLTIIMKCTAQKPLKLQEY